MLTDCFPPNIAGGVERVVFELARVLVHQGHAVGIITLRGPERSYEERLEEIQVWRTRGYGLTRVLGLQSAIAPTIFSDALRVCKSFAPDIIHAHNIFFATSLAGPFLKWRLRRPLVTTMHLSALDHIRGMPGALARAYEALVGRWILQHSDAIVAVSESVRRHGLALGVKPSQIRTILNAVALPDTVAHAPQPLATPRVVFVGRLVANKGPHFFVRAAMRVLASVDNVEFLLIGDGPMRRPLESVAKRSKFANRIRFLGFRNDVSDILRSATLFVRPSLLEGYPLTILEAMTHGVPVIASDIPGNADIIRHGDTGILTEVGNVRVLSDTIVMLLRSAQARERLAGRAKDVARSHPKWTQAGLQLVKVYEGLLGPQLPLPSRVGQPL